MYCCDHHVSVWIQGVISLTWSDEGQSLCRGPGSLSGPCVGTHSIGHVGQRDGQIDGQLSVQSGIHNKLSQRKEGNSQYGADWGFSFYLCVLCCVSQTDLLCSRCAVLHHEALQFPIQLSWRNLPHHPHLRPVQHRRHVNRRVLWYWNTHKKPLNLNHSTSLTLTWIHHL